MKNKHIRPLMKAGLWNRSRTFINDQQTVNSGDFIFSEQPYYVRDLNEQIRHSHSQPVKLGSLVSGLKGAICRKSWFFISYLDDLILTSSDRLERQLIRTLVRMLVNAASSLLWIFFITVGRVGRHHKELGKRPQNHPFLETASLSFRLWRST